MIIVKVIGGLGNQMFQYAAGRALAIRHNCELKLDTTSFENYAHHQGFELNSVFGIDSLKLDQKELDMLLGWRRLKIANALIRRWQGLQFGNPKIINEPHFHYWHGWENLVGSIYITGYWQSERYFINQGEQIRNDFKFNKSLDIQSEEFAKQISDVNSISLHIRRGDYVSNPKNMEIHGFCGSTYYEEAIKHLVTKYGDVKLFIFSDDIEWVRKNINLGMYKHTFVNHNTGINSWRDMKLMSLCKHNIIANSSFSWWAAWLNKNPSKTVIAPKNWFATQKINSKDVLAKNWIAL